MTIRAVAVVAALLAACSAEDGIPEDHGQLEAHVDGDPIAPYHTYHFFVIDPATNEYLYEDELAVDQVVMPVDSRFVTALPAKRPLLVGVYATDANHIVVGAGSVVIALTPKQKTSVQIEVLAHAAGQAGSLDAQLSDAQLPSRVAFAPSPSTNKRAARRSCSAGSPTRPAARRSPTSSQSTSIARSRRCSSSRTAA